MKPTPDDKDSIRVVLAVAQSVPRALGFRSAEPRRPGYGAHSLAAGLPVGEVNPRLSAVTGMTRGMVVDDTAHFLSKYLRARREKGYAPADAMRYAYAGVGTAR